MLTVQNLTELDVTKVQQTLEFISGLLQEDNPSLDLKRGVMHDLVAYYSSVLATSTQENIDRVRRSSSLLAIQADPTLAVDDVVDRVLSNYQITRKQGTKATGTATVIVSARETVTIPAGAIFTANGVSFVTAVPYTAVTSSANVTSDNDRVLTSRGDGTYYFTLELVASASGADGLVKKNTLLVPTLSILNFVKAYATSDFIDGTDTETNDQILARMQEGIAAKTLSNRVNISATIKESVTTVTDLSIIGYGDEEMLRDQHSLFPVSGGGRSDIYVRTQPSPQLLGLTKTATLVEKTLDDKGIWQISIGRDEAPGFYDVTEIKPIDANETYGSFEITNEIRANDLTNVAGELTPDIVSLMEGAYSRYQTATVRFKDTETNTLTLSLGDTKEYTVTVRAMSDVVDVQTLVGSRSVRNYAGDVLVKAAVPCFVSLSFTLQGKPGEKLPDAETIKTALAQYVNTAGFCGRLHASALSDIIHNYLTGKVAVSAIDMFGQIRRPDGTVKLLRSTEVLTVPNEPDLMVSARTTIFILDVENIAISAQTVNIPEI